MIKDSKFFSLYTLKNTLSRKAIDFKINYFTSNAVEFRKIKQNIKERIEHSDDNIFQIRILTFILNAKCI